MTSDFLANFLGSILMGFLLLYFTFAILYSFLSYRDFFRYRPPRYDRDID